MGVGVVVGKGVGVGIGVAVGVGVAEGEEVREGRLLSPWARTTKWRLKNCSIPLVSI